MTATDSEDLLVARPEPGVLLVTLNRPAARNALRTATLDQLAQVLDAAAADADVGAVVLTGSDKFFAAGADLKEMAAMGPIELWADVRPRHWKRIAAFSKPLLAAVNGHADAVTAMHCGLVSEVLPSAEVLPRTLVLARTIAAKAPLAGRAAKESVLLAYETGLTSALETERKTFVLLAASRDRNEGIAAFLEKRPPSYQGR